MTKYKSGDIVITTANHIIKIIGVDTEWNKKTKDDEVYYTYEMIEQSDACYVGERISGSNIVGYHNIVGGNK